MSRIELVPRTRQEVLEEIDTWPDEIRAELSPDWMSRISDPERVDAWTLGFAIIDRASGTKVGSCGFKTPPDASGTVEIAYGIDAQHQGKGFATEAAMAMVAHAAKSGKVRTVIAHTLPENNASARVLTKCGFENVGEVIDPEDGLVWRWEQPLVRST
jgi:ribosomal-protein-alanine N-acetyltransferase